MPHELPIIDSVNNMSKSELEALKHVGFAYVKTPNYEKVQKALESIEKTALSFFRQASDKKERFPVGEEMAGFADRSKGAAPQRVQQFFFRPEKPLWKFLDKQDEINIIQNTFQEKIAIPLLQAIFTSLSIGEKCNAAIAGAVSSLSFPYYPPIDKVDSIQNPALNEHKDFDFITVLHITKPGLQVWIEEDGLTKWVNVDPKPGYVVVNLANALELVLGKGCNSALHRVNLSNIEGGNDERMSIGFFIGPAWNKPLVNVFTGEVLYNNYYDYIQEQFRTQYNDPQKNPQLRKAPTTLASAATHGDLLWKRGEENSDAPSPIEPNATVTTYGMK